jgi:hypothetical protein
LGFPGSLCRLTMVASSTITLCVLSSSLMAFSFAYPALTHLSKTGRPSGFFAQLTIVCVLFFFTVQIHLRSGTRCSPWQRSSSTGAPVAPPTIAHHTSFFSVYPRTTACSASSAPGATPT